MSEFAILVACSDDRKDIFDTCFSHSEKIWAECNWPRFVGFNTKHPDCYGFKVVTSPHKEWRLAVGDYLDAMPEQVKYVLLMVEDTLFMKPVNGEELSEAASWAWSTGVPYLRLVPIRRSWLDRIWQAAINLETASYPQRYDAIPKSHPYYSSTEMALWRRSYLRELLDKPADAWQFENHVTDKNHYAWRHPIFDQHQIVQKGKWNRVAPKLLRQAGLRTRGLKWQTKRPMQPRLAWLRGKWQNLNFELFGFTSLRVRRWLTNASVKS